MVQSLRISNQAMITIDLNEDENGRLLERLARRWWQMTSMKSCHLSSAICLYTLKHLY